ncbi:MAG: UvrB/UvrC motif-containing protein [Candidatus Edwardsbacteria bacterium]|nr:UvrB/UvrC motif-containing protein [Candidatus Edwardsbacteria bacterium]
MLCDNCKKNEAAIRYTEIRDGSAFTRNLCDACARDKGITDPLEKTILSLGSVISDAIKAFLETELEAAKLSCPSCGLTMAKFQKSGRLGCGGCYRAFAAALDPMLKQIHGADRHFGKSADRRNAGTEAGPDNRCHALMRRLHEAVELEDFELAAHLRDQIREMEAQVKA